MLRSRYLLAERLTSLTFPTAVTLIYLFLIIPSVLVIPMSFAGTDVLTFPPSSYSLDLYRQFFSDPVWTDGLRESLLVASCTALVATAIGTLATFGLARGRFPGQKIFGMVLLSPILLPTIVTALGFYFYFSYLGIVGTSFGLVAADSALTIPYVIVATTAGIRQIDPNIELAASMMGASPISVFCRVVLPQIKSSLIAAALFAFLISFDEVVIAWFIAGTNTATLPVVMFGSIKMGVSPVIAAAASLLSFTSATICIVSGLLQRPRSGRD